MTNYDKILNDMTVEKMADYLIKDVLIDNGDWGYDGYDEYYVENYQTFFTTPANDDEYWDYEECFENTVLWLKEEFNES